MLAFLALDWRAVGRCRHSIPLHAFIAQPQLRFVCRAPAHCTIAFFFSLPLSFHVALNIGADSLSLLTSALPSVARLQALAMCLGQWWAGTDVRTTQFCGAARSGSRRLAFATLHCFPPCVNCHSKQMPLKNKCARHCNQERRHCNQERLKNECT